MTDPRPDESGLTLVELVVAIAIMAIIIVPLAGAVMIGLVATPIAGQRTSNSADAQLVSSYFVPDIQSSSGVVYEPGQAACNEAGVAGTPTQTVLQLTGVDPNSSLPFNVDYFIWQPSSAGQLPRVSRVQCESGSLVGQATAMISNLVAGSFTVSINGTSCATSPLPGDCSLPPLGATVQLAATDSGANNRTNAYQIQVAATQRTTAPSLIGVIGASGTSITASFSDLLCRSATFTSSDWSVSGSTQGAIAVASDNLPTCNGSYTNGVRSAMVTTGAPVQVGQTVSVSLTPSGTTKLVNSSGTPPAVSTQTYGS